VTFTVDAVAEPLHVPPRVAITGTEDDPDLSLQSVALFRDGVPLRFETVVTGDQAVAYDYDAPFDVELLYRADAVAQGTIEDWAETWASVAAWTGSGWAAGSGVASSTTAAAVIYRDVSGPIVKVDVTDPDNLTLQLTDSSDAVVVSVLVSPDGTVTLSGTSSTKVTGSGSFTVTLSETTVSIEGTGWSASVAYSGVPTRVRLVAPGVTTFLAKFGSFGTTTAHFNKPEGIAIDASGNIWVVDDENHRVLKFDPSGAYLSSFGSFGTGDGQFNNPQGIAIDASGNIWVTDRDNDRVQKFDSSGAFLLKFGSNGTGNGQFDTPTGIAIDSGGNAWVVDYENERVQKFNSAGVYQTKFGSGFGSGNGQFNNPTGIAIDSGGNLWVVDSGNHRVQKFNSSGVYQTKFGTLGSGNGQFNTPNWIAIDASGNLWITDGANHRVQKFDSAGAFLAKFGSFGTGDGQFNTPTGIAINSGGDVLVSDLLNHRVQIFSTDGGTVDDITATYSEDAIEATASDTETLTGVDGAWLTNSMIPDLAVPLAGRKGPDITHSIQATTRAETSLVSNAISLPIEGSADILTVTIGPRGKETWNLDILCRDQAARNELLATLANNAVIGLRFPTGIGGGLTDGFYAVGDLAPSRLGLPSAAAGHLISLPLTPARAPKFKPLWQWNMNTLAQSGMTMDDVNAAFTSMNDLLIGPN
jgi:DNA-binding beta-propeller fold protein YncE